MKKKKCDEVEEGKRKVRVGRERVRIVSGESEEWWRRER